MTEALDRFLAKVRLDPATGCWLWTASIRPDGYGQFWTGLRTDAGHPRPIVAHKWAYEFFIGPVPDGFELDHLCRVRGCANPFDLELVTHHENLLRGIGGETTRQRHALVTHCPSGHEYTPENTLLWKSGRWTKRRCRTCESARRRVAA